MENVATSVLSNSTSTIAIVIGVVAVAGIIAWLINRGKLNIKSDKFNVESAKQNTKALVIEARNSCEQMIYAYVEEYIQKFPDQKYQIMWIAERVLDYFETILHFNTVSTKEDYLKMRYTGIKAIIDAHKIAGGNYDEDFYKKLYENYVEIIKQIILLKNHYNDE